jgi:hypothetical protein
MNNNQPTSSQNPRMDNTAEVRRAESRENTETRPEDNCDCEFCRQEGTIPAGAD